MVALFTRTKTNPVFFSDELRRMLADEPERAERVFNDPDSVDLLTWNVFASLDRHSDGAWLAHRLKALGGDAVRPPVRLSLWTGRTREPLLEPSTAYVRSIRERAGQDSDLAEFTRPVEVPVRIETPDVLMLVDTTLGHTRPGAGGRDRLIELIDAGLDHSRRLSKSLAISVVYASGTQAAAELSDRLNRLRSPATLAQSLPFRSNLPPVILRELPWQQLLRMWASEVPYLGIQDQPVKAFLEHTAARGLR